MKHSTHGRWRRAAAAAACLLLVAGPVAALGPPEKKGWESAERVGRTAYDLLLLRPLNLGFTLISLVGFAVAYPASLVIGGSEDVKDILLDDPIERTFKRPLGEL